MKRQIFFLLLALLVSCKLPTETDGLTSSTPKASIAKWFNNHTAAITLTNDAGHCHNQSEFGVQEIIKLAGLHMDYEWVTGTVNTSDQDHMLTNLSKSNFSYFGHGHTHDDHDKMDSIKAYGSFKKCYDTMCESGMSPIAYAYPYGAGRHRDTQEACKKAGFLAARGFETEKDNYSSVHIMPYDATEPENWFHLPTVRMEAHDAKKLNKSDKYGDKTYYEGDELNPILDDALDLKSWIILTYHGIGTNSWGFTYIDDFIKNINAIKKRDFWCTSMNEITLYTYERAAASVNITQIDSNSFTLMVSDGLGNEKFNVPLTLILEDSKWEDGAQIVFEDSTYTVKDGLVTINICPDEKSYLVTLQK